MPRYVDIKKKSNIKCLYCQYGGCGGCSRHPEYATRIIYYWNRCKHFEWSSSVYEHYCAMQPITARPVPRFATFTGSGWVSPAGTLYPCAFTQHIEMAQYIITGKWRGDLEKLDRNWEHILERGGWVKLTNGRVEFLRCTQSQLDTVFDLLDAKAVKPMLDYLNQNDL